MENELMALLEANSKEHKTYYCKNQYQQSYVDWLEDPARDWKWTLTLTFSNQEISQGAAMEKLRKFVRRINRQFYGKNAEKRNDRPSVSLVASWETNSSDGIHFHAVIEDIKNVRDEQWHLVKNQHNLESYLLREWTALKGGKQMKLKSVYNRQGSLKYVVKEAAEAEDNVICDYLHKYNSKCDAA